MAFLRDYDISNLGVGESTVINAVGDFIAIRRESTGTVRVKAFNTPTGGNIVFDCVLTAGEKIRSSDKFKRVEFENIDVATLNITATMGQGNFESDIVEGTVQIIDSTTGFITVSHSKGIKTDVVALADLPATLSTPKMNSALVLNNTDKEIKIYSDIGGSTDGFPIAAGQSLSINSRSEFYLIADVSPTTGQVNVLYEVYI